MSREGSSGIRLHRAALEVNGMIWGEGRHDGPFVPGRTVIYLQVYDPSLQRYAGTRATLLLDFRSEDEVERLRARVAELEGGADA